MYISGDPIKLGRFLTFNWRAGIAKDYYGYQNEIRENKYYSVGLMGNTERFPDGSIIQIVRSRDIRRIFMIRSVRRNRLI